MKDERGDTLLAESTWLKWGRRFKDTLEGYHRQFPLRTGMPREEFKSRLNLPPRLAEAALDRAAGENVLRFNEKWVWRPNHTVRFEGNVGVQVDLLLKQFESAPFAPPSYDEAVEAVGSEAVVSLIERGQLVKVSDAVLLTPQGERAMINWVVESIRERGKITAAELRDHFSTSRKYAIAFLEYLDQKRVTRRLGDARVLR